jgi:hypothetical protein
MRKFELVNQRRDLTMLGLAIPPSLSTKQTFAATQLTVALGAGRKSKNLGRGWRFTTEPACRGAASVSNRRGPGAQL